MEKGLKVRWDCFQFFFLIVSKESSVCVYSCKLTGKNCSPQRTVETAMQAGTAFDVR